MLTTAQLIELLRSEDPGGKRIVVLQSDSEGNSYHLLEAVDGNCRARIEGHCVDIGIETLTPTLKDRGFSTEDKLSGRTKPALVLAP
jgi:hypothetical protein